MSPLRRTILALAIVLATPPALGQSVTGTHGLLTIPTARMHPDGTLVVGGGFVDQAFSTYMDGRTDYAPLYGSITFLPSVELGFRFSRALDTGQPQAVGDRMFLVRVRLVEEGDAWPAVAVGAHDFLRSSGSQTNFFNALYAVASKRLEPRGALGSVVPEVDLHLGWGTDIIEASGYQFVGPFGGATLTLLQSDSGVVSRLGLLAEYDGRTVSVGPRLALRERLVLTVGIQGLEAPVAGLALQTEL